MDTTGRVTTLVRYLYAVFYVLHHYKLSGYRHIILVKIHLSSKTFRTVGYRYIEKNSNEIKSSQTCTPKTK